MYEFIIDCFPELSDLFKCLVLFFQKRDLV